MSELINLAKQALTLGVPGLLLVAVYFLWKKLNEMQAKYESLLDRYHMAMQQESLNLQALTALIKEEEK